VGSECQSRDLCVRCGAQERGHLTWSKPPPGYVKINRDGGEAESMSGATGVVIRDENGVFIKAMVRTFPSVASALVVEAEA
jgi:hypothetical protein